MYIASRVVPAVGLTMLRSSPRRALESDDLRKCHFRVSGRGAGIVSELARELGEPILTEQVTLFQTLNRGTQAVRYADALCVANTAQRLLLLLSLAGCPQTVSELSSAASLPQPRVSMALQSLRNSGHITGGEQKSDRRTRSYTLTPAGSRIAISMLAFFSVDAR